MWRHMIFCAIAWINNIAVGRKQSYESEHSAPWRILVGSSAPWDGALNFLYLQNTDVSAYCERGVLHYEMQSN